MLSGIERSSSKYAALKRIAMIMVGEQARLLGQVSGYPPNATAEEKGGGVEMRKRNHAGFGETTVSTIKEESEHDDGMHGSKRSGDDEDGTPEDTDEGKVLTEAQLRRGWGGARAASKKASLASSFTSSKLAKTPKITTSKTPSSSERRGSANDERIGNRRKLKMLSITSSLTSRRSSTKSSSAESVSSAATSGTSGSGIRLGHQHDPSGLVSSRLPNRAASRRAGARRPSASPPSERIPPHLPKDQEGSGSSLAKSRCS